MSERGAAERTARIVLALDSAAPEGLALDIIRCMARDRLDELLGLVIEDAHVLQHARSGLAREILHSGTEHALETATLARQLRAQSEATRRRFESAAARLGIRCRSEVTQGEVLDELSRCAALGESLVVSEALEAAGHRPTWRRVLGALPPAQMRSVLFARAGWATGGSVLAVIDEPSSAEALLRSATLLAEHSRSPLRVVLAPKAGSDREALIAAVEKARTTNRSLPPVYGLTGTAEALSAAARRERARLIVVAWGEHVDESESLALLFASTRSAILLLR